MLQTERYVEINQVTRGRLIIKNPDQYITVPVRDGNIEKAINILRKKINNSGMRTQLSRKKFAESRGEKCRRKKQEAQRRIKREANKIKEGKTPNNGRQK